MKVRTKVAFLLLLAGCSAPPPAPPPVPSGPPPATREEALGALAALERSFYSHWGAVETTAEYARLRPGHVPYLRAVADENGPHALMALRVLARLAPGETFSAEARAILYATAFQKEANFARWGVVGKTGFLPGVYGHEMLRLGAAVEPYLRRSLSDRRRAEVAGTGERDNRNRRDRVCDLAWVFLATIFDRPLVYHEDPEYRDPQIRELEVWLEKRRR